jgi:hypothetical protein
MNLAVCSSSRFTNNLGRVGAVQGSEQYVAVAPCGTLGVT